MSDENAKIGAGHLSAMARLGLRELRGALYPQSNVAQPSELGLYGTATPHEVHQARHGEREAEGAERNDGAEGQESIVASRLEQAQARDESAPVAKAMERE